MVAGLAAAERGGPVGAVVNTDDYDARVQASLRARVERIYGAALRIEGEARRDKAMGRVERHAPPEWNDAASRALWRVVQRCRDFTTDDVWAELVFEDAPPEPRALGPVIRRAATGGFIAATGGYVKSVRPECHRRPVAVWRPTARVARKIEDDRLRSELADDLADARERAGRDDGGS